MRIIFFTKYTSKGASSRLRFYQFESILNASNFDCKYYPLFSDKYLEVLYKRSFIIYRLYEAIYCYFIRLINLFKIKNNDIIFIEKELFPYIPPLFEYLLAKLGFNFIVDFDDAIHHNYDKNNFFLIKILLQNKIPKVMNYANQVIVGNNYLYAYSKKNNIKNVTNIPTVIDNKKYYKKTTIDNSNIIIGWIGTPATSFFLDNILEVFEKLNSAYKIRINLVGARHNDFEHDFIDCIEWTEETEIASIQNFDIGVMPLRDFNSFEKGKCGYKLIQYMACGIPVIGSPIGENNIIIDEGINGFFANTNDEWEYFLEKLICDKNLRQSLGNEGYRKVQETYTTEIQGPNVIKIINEVNK